MFSRRWNDDTGSAALEFISVGMLLIVPLVYLVIALAQLQAGALAAEGAARNAARTIALHGENGMHAAEATVALALADAGLAGAPYDIHVDCGGDCQAPGGSITISVTAQIPLPLVPQALDLDTALAIPISASSTQPISLHAPAEGR